MGDCGRHAAAQELAQVHHRPECQRRRTTLQMGAEEQHGATPHYPAPGPAGHRQQPHYKAPAGHPDVGRPLERRPGTHRAPWRPAPPTYGGANQTSSPSSQAARRKGPMDGGPRNSSLFPPLGQTSSQSSTTFGSATGHGRRSSSLASSRSSPSQAPQRRPSSGRLGLCHLSIGSGWPPGGSRPNHGLSQFTEAHIKALRSWPIEPTPPWTSHTGEVNARR